jgi:hypothetical protein
MNIKLTWKSWLIALFILLFAAACTSSTGEESANDTEETEHMDEDMDHMDEDTEHMDENMDHDHEEGMEPDRIPNNGAVIRIVSPADGATFSNDETVIVEIEVENFELGVDGNHWHVSIDGESWGMVMGTNTDQPLNGLESGTHKIEVLLANGAHEDLQEGDSIEITVEE